ncbi:MAG: 3-dehydroquinate synthase [Gammaproteobacteria bacterium]
MKTLTEAGVGYPVWVGGAEAAESLAALCSDRDVLMLSDENVAPHYLQPLCAQLGTPSRVERLVLPAGEHSKSMAGLGQVLDALIAGAFHRDAVLVALGGGVIGDLGGFAAACYQRSIDWIAVPTTLLAQVDAAIGGKTAINHARGKNLIGAFHDPLAVWADPARLNTLPEREYRSGLGEVVKYALGFDAQFFDWLECHADELLAREEPALSTAIETGARIKLEVVAADRTEQGRRALLNLGHTLGHALETALGHGAWLHGEAVAVGLVAAAELSAGRGCLQADEVTRVRGLLQAFGLPISIPSTVQDTALDAALALDKKIVSGQLRFIGLTALGEATIWPDVKHRELEEAISAVRE